MKAVLFIYSARWDGMGLAQTVIRLSGHLASKRAGKPGRGSRDCPFGPKLLGRSRAFASSEHSPLALFRHGIKGNDRPPIAPSISASPLPFVVPLPRRSCLCPLLLFASARRQATGPSIVVVHDHRVSMVNGGK